MFKSTTFIENEYLQCLDLRDFVIMYSVEERNDQWKKHRNFQAESAVVHPVILSDSVLNHVLHQKVQEESLPRAMMASLFLVSVNIYLKP